MNSCPPYRYTTYLPRPHNGLATSPSLALETHLLLLSINPEHCGRGITKPSFFFSLILYDKDPHSNTLAVFIYHFEKPSFFAAHFGGDRG
jgi:hypothetical protein